MNQLKQNTPNSDQFKEHIQSILEEMLVTNDLWTIEKVEIDQSRSEIHVYINTHFETLHPCSHCNRFCNPSKTDTNGISTYLSLCGMRTYIHADRIQIDCPQYGTQFITPPWDKQINEQLKLSIL